MLIDILWAWAEAFIRWLHVIAGRLRHTCRIGLAVCVAGVSGASTAAAASCDAVMPLVFSTEIPLVSGLDDPITTLVWSTDSSRLIGLGLRRARVDVDVPAKSAKVDLAGKIGRNHAFARGAYGGSKLSADGQHILAADASGVQIARVADDEVFVRWSKLLRLGLGDAAFGGPDSAWLALRMLPSRPSSTHPIVAHAFGPNGDVTVYSAHLADSPAVLRTLSAWMSVDAGDLTTVSIVSVVHPIVEGARKPPQIKIVNGRKNTGSGIVFSSTTADIPPANITGEGILNNHHAMIAPDGKKARVILSAKPQDKAYSLDLASGAATEINYQRETRSDIGEDNYTVHWLAGTELLLRTSRRYALTGPEADRVRELTGPVAAVLGVSLKMWTSVELKALSGEQLCLSDFTSSDIRSLPSPDGRLVAIATNDRIDIRALKLK
jgi:hypothetical protein